MSRTFAELRQAAIKAGWPGDPLADEIIEALATTEASPRPRTEPTQQNTNADYDLLKTELEELKAKRSEPQRSFRLLMIVAVGGIAAALGTSIGWISSVHAQRQMLLEKNQEISRVFSMADAEIARLKETNAAQLAQATRSIEAAMSGLQSVAKSSETAAGSNAAAVNLYLTKFQALLDNFQQMRDHQQAASKQAAQPGTTSK